MAQKENSTISEFSFDEVIKAATKWFKYLLAKWWIFAIVGFAAAGLGIWTAYINKPQYQSYLTFALQDNGGGGLGGALSLAAEFGLNIGGGGEDVFSGDNIIPILSSRRIVEELLVSVDTVDGQPITFANYYKQINQDKEAKQKTKPSRIDSVSFPVGLPRAKYTYLQDSVLYNMYQEVIKQIVAQRTDKKLNMFEVSFTSADERFTKVFTQNLVKKAIDFYTTLRIKKSKETLEILEKRVGMMKGNANAAISGRASIQDANINPALAAQSAELQKKQLDLSAYGGAYGELFKNLEMARFQYLKEVPLLQIIDDVRYPMKRIKKGKMITGITFAFVAEALTLFVLFFIYVWSRKKKALAV